MEQSPRRLNFTLIKNQILAGWVFFSFFCLKRIQQLTEPQHPPFMGTPLAVTVPTDACTPGLQNSPPHLQTPLILPNFSPF